MEEKKVKEIRDLTGNRGEHIAEKRQTRDAAREENAPRDNRGGRNTKRRPFVRPGKAAEGAELVEHISAKPASAGDEPSAEPKAAARRPFERRDTRAEAGERRERSHAPQEKRQQERRNGKGPKPERQDRQSRKPTDAPEQASAPEKAQNAPEKARIERPANQPNAQEARKGRQNREDGRRNNRAGKKPRQNPRNADAEKKKQENETAAVIPAAAGKKENANGGAGTNARGTRGSARMNSLNGTRQNPRAQQQNGAQGTFGEEKETYQFTDEELRADGLLFMLDEPSETPAVQEEKPEEEGELCEVVGIRFRGAGKAYSFSPNGIQFSEGEHAIVETVHGMEYGEVVAGNHTVRSSELVSPLKPVLRKASSIDDERNRCNREMEADARPIFLEKVAKNKLDMQLVDVEYTFDNTKLCFYFTADGRVDFRELVKDLASVFRTRIELRQIGVRDEARMCGGLGICGRPFCCKSFLADFTQVSIKMAKEQNLSLASAKISGSCGRLMCCLRYEQDTYERESAKLPRQNSMVDTPNGVSKVLESNFLTGQIKVYCTADGVVRYFKPEEVRPLPKPTQPSAEQASPEADGAEEQTEA